MTAWVRMLDDPATRDVAVSGGKGASLAVLRTGGARVPDGFVLVAAAGRDRAPGQPPGPEVTVAVTAAYDALAARAGQGPDPWVAVRSSGVAEDAVRASAAGLFGTDLGVRGAAAVLTSVVSCWDSGRAPQVAAYLARHGDPGAPIDVAVVVQLLVPARCAGVAFTVHPVTGDPATVVVEATPGLGALVADGAVVPEHLEVARAGLAVRDRRPGRRAVALRVGAAGVSRVPVTGAATVGTVLDDEGAAAVAGAALAVEGLLGYPVDVEWAVDDRDGAVVVLQGRAVTVAGPSGKEPG